MISEFTRYLIEMLLQYPEKLFILNTSNLAVKARYSVAFRVKVSIKSEEFHLYRE